jgi:preprotein translocase subunit SecG
MLAFFTVVHIFLCIFMMFVILLQPGKDAGMGAALGGGAATSAFGGRGAVTFLSKLTAVCAVLFFITSLGLSFVGTHASVAGGPDEVSARSKKGRAAPTAADAGVATGTAGSAADGGSTSTPAKPSEPTAH